MPLSCKVAVVNLATNGGGITITPFGEKPRSCKGTPRYFLQSDIFVKMYDTGESKMKRIAPQKEIPLLRKFL